MSDVENDNKQPLSRLDRAAERSTQRLNELEGRLKAYESRLELLLQNTKGLVEEVVVKCDQLDATERLIDDALENKIPAVNKDLEEIEATVSQLEKELPEKQRMIDGMNTLYHSGRKRLRILEDELSWLTTPYIIQVLKTSSLVYNIPRSKRWIRNVRLGAYTFVALFALWIHWLFNSP